MQEKRSSILSISTAIRRDGNGKAFSCPLPIFNGPSLTWHFLEIVLRLLRLRPDLSVMSFANNCILGRVA